MTLGQLISGFNLILCVIGSVNAVLMIMHVPRFRIRWWAGVAALAVYLQYTGLVIDWYVNYRAVLPELIETAWAVFHTSWISLLGIHCNLMMRCAKRSAKLKGDRRGDHTGEHRAVQ